MFRVTLGFAPGFRSLGLRGRSLFFGFWIRRDLLDPDTCLWRESAAALSISERAHRLDGTSPASLKMAL